MIGFAYPLALFSLLAVPLLLALHLLRPKRRRVVVSSIGLWQAVLREREGAEGFRRLLRNLSLLLLLATALALGFALGGPEWSGPAREGADTVLVLDVSASMKTRAGIAGTRFDLALAEAGRIVDGLPRDGRMLVMTSGRRPVLRSAFESDRATLRRVLREARAGDEAGRPREALALALTLLEGRDSGRVYFLTDGAFDPEVNPGSPQIVFRRVGDSARNVAITRFDLRQQPASEERFQVLLSVRNYTDAPAEVPASASLNGERLFTRTVQLGPGAEQTLVLPFTGRAFGEAAARIEVDDDLAADNQAFAAIHSVDPLRVLLYTRGNFFLRSVLEALPQVNLRVQEGAPGEDLAEAAAGHDVVVLDGLAPDRLPPGSFLLVDALPGGLPFSDSGRVGRASVAGTGRSPLVRNLDLSGVRVEAARRVAVEDRSAGLQRLFWASETDLALALLDDRRRLVYLGFDLRRSNFPLLAAFPLFVRQSLEWLRPGAENFASTHIAAGMAFPLRLPLGVQEVRVQTPAGDREIHAVEDGTLYIEATQDAGIYRYQAGGAEQVFAVSLTDARESDVNARWTPETQAAQPSPAPVNAQMLVPLWPYLLLLALALLAIEWCLWTRSRSSA